jgi:hypothetical protein
MQHTFLFEPGIWTAEGTFWTADGRDISADGRTEITQGSSTRASQGKECGWVIAGRLRVLSSPPAEFVSIYCVMPSEKDPLTYKMTSENSTLGKLHGVFTITGPTIMSMYRSEQGNYQGTEHLRQIHSHHYEACGVLLMDDRRLSSWRVDLRR